MHREELLEKLVTTRHLSVPEREALGIASVPVYEVAATVKHLLEGNGVFPPSAKTWQPGQPVFEGFFLLNKPNGGVRLVTQRDKPTELPSLLNEPPFAVLPRIIDTEATLGRS